MGVPVVTTLPYTENFDTTAAPALPVALQIKAGQFATVAAPAAFPPPGNVNVLEATRPTVGARPVATVDLDPATAAIVANVNVNVSTGGGNGSTLWSNAVIVFDYVSPTNYKFAGVFEIIDRLIIGQVVNGKVSYLAQRAFPRSPNTSIPLKPRRSTASPGR